MARSLTLGLALFHLALAMTHNALPSTPTATFTTATTTTLTTITSTPSRVSRTHILPSTKPSSTTASFDLGTSKIDTELFSLNIAGQDIPIKCVDCSTSGALEVFVRNAEANDTSSKHRKRNFDLDLDWPDFSGDLVARFPKGLKGHVELSLSAPSQLSHDFTLAKWPLIGVVVPGIGDAGVVASLVVPLSLELASAAELSFGFNFSVPQNASLNVTFPWIDDSTSYGFLSSEGLEMNSLPVELNIPGLDITLTTGLRLELSVGVKSSGDGAVAQTGATLNLPKVTIEEEQVVNVDETCHALSRNLSTTPKTLEMSSANSTFSNTTNSLDFSSVIGDYTLISPSIGVSLDLFAKAAMTADMGAIDFDFDKATEYNVFKTGWLLPTLCHNNSPTTTRAPPTFWPTASIDNAGRVVSRTSSAASTSTASPLPTNGGERMTSRSVAALLVAIAWAVLVT